MSLFKLIHSLSTTEKRRFVINNDASKKYMKLYRKINQQKNEDNAQLDKIGFNATDRNTLYKKVLETLSVLRLHQTTQIDSYLNFWIGNLDELFERNLIDDLYKHLNKIKKLAYKRDKFIHIIEILNFEKLLLVRNIENNAQEKHNKLIKEESKIIRYLSEEKQYYNLNNQVYLLRTASPPYSKISKIYYYSLKSIFAEYEDQPKLTFHNLHHLLQLFEDDEEFLKDNLPAYFASLSLSAESCIYFENDALMDEILSKMESIEGLGEEIFNSIGNANKELGERYIHIFEKILKKDASIFKSGRMLAFYYNIVVFKCLFAEWNSAYEWLGKIIKFKRTEERKDIQYAARLLKFLIIAECEELEFSTHIQAIRKYYKSHHLNNETNQNIINHFAKINKATNNETPTIIKQFNTFLNNLIDTLGQQKKQPPLGIVELELWTASKLKRTTIGEIMKVRNAS